MKYCSECLMPDTKPYIKFDEQGVCNACGSHHLKNRQMEGIDWHSREQEFDQIVLGAKSKRAPFYDALVPVSGGKDSITQVHRLLKFNLRILAVNVDYGIKTQVGWHNLMLIANMGANLSIYRPAQPLHRRLIHIGMQDFGDPDLLSHTLLHAYPLHMALRFQIPLVVLGENSAFEYGGDVELAGKNMMTRDWFSNYAANKGHDARYVSDKYDLPFEELRLYDFPDELEKSETTRTIFLSHFFFWDSEAHLEIARTYGFKTPDDAREGTYRNYVGIDEKINRIHQYIKVLKFGYGRATDHACEDIRNGRLTRPAAKNLIRQYDLQDLSDDYVDDFVKYLQITRTEFLGMLEKYRNLDIWRRDSQGKWFIPRHLED
jgi:N-acetyl sugar amidotransferase